MLSSTSLTNFVPLAKIGEGSFSSVYQVRRITDNKIYALKKIKIDNLKEKEKSNALNQIRILASIDSSYIISYKEAFFDEKLRLLCIVMEWANGSDLHQLINQHKAKMSRFPEQQIWKAAYQMLSGLQTLHKNSILHRDIKSANIFISDGVYKLGDLNVSKIKDGPSLLAKTQTGTPFYASPQIWRDEPYDTESDIWSFGCIIYEMCCLKPPFHGKNLSQLYKQVQKGHYQPIPPTYSRELSKLIEKCLTSRPKNRPSASQFLREKGIIRQRCQFYEICIDRLPEKEESSLLSTIKMPFDMKLLNSKLPSSKYEGSTKDNAKTILKTSQASSSQRSQFQNKRFNRVTKTQLGLPDKIKNQLKKINKAIHENKEVKSRPSKHYNNIESSPYRQKMSYLSPVKELPVRKQRPMSCNNKAEIQGEYYINNLLRYSPSAHLKYLSDRKPLPYPSLRRQIRSDRKLFLGNMGSLGMKASQLQQNNKYRCRSENQLNKFSPSLQSKQKFNYKQINQQVRLENVNSNKRMSRLKEQSKSQGDLIRSNFYSDGKGRNYPFQNNYSECYSNEPNYFEKVQKRRVDSGNAKLKRAEHFGGYKIGEAESRIKKMVKDRNFYYKSPSRI